MEIIWVVALLSDDNGLFWKGYLFANPKKCTNLGDWWVCGVMNER